MDWTDRQQAMLRAMGVRLWLPSSATDAAVATPSSGADVQPTAATGEATATGRPAITTARAATGTAPTLAPTAAFVSAPRPAPAPAPEQALPLAAAPSQASPSRSMPPRALPPGIVVTAAALPPATTDASAALAQLDWGALRDTVAGCRACGLCESRTQTVFGVGSRRARWMVVGEAPGEQEDRVGEPFVGPSGQLLDAMLQALALSRADDDGPPAQRVYIANALKCRPPRNRNPAADEMLRCEPYLLRQIALLQPAVILAMGRFAVQALLRSSEPIGRLRGRVHRYQGVPLIVTYHPAYLLRSLPDKARAWEDLCLAASVADGEVAAPPPLPA